MISRQRPITLPADMLPHDTTIEWWYFNGHLKDHDGNDYSFMDCLFRANPEQVNIPYLKNLFARGSTGKYVLFAHSMLANVRRHKTYKNVQNISFASRDSFKRPLFYANYIDPIAAAGGFVVHEMEEVKQNVFHIKTDRLDLTMASMKRPMLEGGEGRIEVRGRKSYYYSLTDLEVSGAVLTGNGWVPVDGRAWMDHQWADVAYAKDKWTWFSFQLDDGTDLMCVEYDDGKGKSYEVDAIGPGGLSWHADAASFAPGKKRWKSKETKATYPLSWAISIPDREIALIATAVLPDQEMIFGAINYWEGSVAVEGIIGKRKVRGRGFMELAGYPTQYNYLQAELGKKIKNFFR